MLTPSVLTFPVGSGVGVVEVCSNVQLNIDTIVEEAEFFSVVLVSTDPLLSADPNRDEARVNINDLTSMSYPQDFANSYFMLFLFSLQWQSLRWTCQRIALQRMAYSRVFLPRFQMG